MGSGKRAGWFLWTIPFCKWCFILALGVESKDEKHFKQVWMRRSKIERSFGTISSCIILFSDFALRGFDTSHLPAKSFHFSSSMEFKGITSHHSHHSFSYLSYFHFTPTHPSPWPSNSPPPPLSSHPHSTHPPPRASKLSKPDFASTPARTAYPNT